MYGIVRWGGIEMGGSCWRRLPSVYTSSFSSFVGARPAQANGLSVGDQTVGSSRTHDLGVILLVLTLTYAYGSQFGNAE